MVMFHEFIREARKNLKFASAKDFFRNKSSILSMSYESYANIEAGKYLPPADKLTSLAEALEIENLRAFIYAYCWTLMPNDLFKAFFEMEDGRTGPLVLRSESYADYREKFQELLKFNRLQAKFELSEEQIAYLETDLVSWDVVNLFISSGDDGLTLEQIAEKTDSGIESTRRRVAELVRVGMLKQLENGGYLVTQQAFIIPRRTVGARLTQLLMRRELEQCFTDERNNPYARFRFLSLDPKERETFETVIDNFILDMRRFRKPQGEGTTHYLQIVFSDRNDLV